MQKMMIIGNLVRDPELRATPSGVTVCNFTVAVNDRRSSGQQSVTYYRVNAWRQLGENCQRYLAKGRKVYVAGPLMASTYQASDGSTRVNLDINAEDVEFLSGRNEADAQEAAYQQQEREAIQQETRHHEQQQSMYTAVETDELPF